MRPVLIQQPQVVLDTTALENTFDNMGQSMLQLARVQDQTNRHLQQHIQQGQVNMQAHAGALHELANSTQQRNYDSFSIRKHDSKPNEPLRLYIYRYSKLHKAVTQKDAAQDTDPSRWFRFLTSITNTSIADKVT